ncbi:IPT/TIG domain-containing protein [Catenuloplanes sp. NPDC051500]|uniref:IPT/TIG domain-containing protein n=1 Tax=Catenuloplanes sp. NPDC051500 TaxID=3363959 RepID=UPI0037A41F0E
MRFTRRGLLSRGAALLTVALGVAAVPVPAAAAAPVSRLPHAVGGYVQSPILQKVRGAHATADLPVSVDLRSYAPSPGDQGQVGSCVSWSIAYQIMGYYAKRQAGVGAPYAPLYLYMRTVASGGAPSAGTNPDNALTVASAGGVDTQEHYFQGTTGWQTPPTADEIENAKKYKVSGWQRLWVGANQGANAQTAVKEALASGQPVAIGFPVYQDFMNLRSHTNYTTTSGTSLGGHMVALMGYDATGVIIRNSWGTGWGNSGDAHLSWSFVQTAVNGAYTVSGISTPASQVELTPSVASLSAKSGPASGGTAVTITGSGLSTATAVRFGATSAQFTASTSGGVTKLVATAPAGASGSTVNVTVTNGAGTSAAGTGTTFAYTPSGPSVSALSPLSTVVYGGTTITLTGADLTGVRSVTVGTRTVSYKAAAGGASLTFAAPAQVAGAYPVKVTTSYGVSTPVTLTYVPPNAPAVTATSTSTASTFKATPLTITGTNLLKATMSLGGKTVSGTVTDTKITVSLPARPAGDVPLTITTAGGAATVTVSYTPPAKPVLSAPATTGLTYKATQITLDGTALADATALTLGSQKLTFTKVSATQVKATFPVKTAGDYELRVTTPGGTSDPVTFSYVAPAKPVISTLSATSAPQKKTITITLTGTGLTDASAVTLGGTRTTFTKVSGTQLKVTFPAKAAGTYDVLVTTPGGTSEKASFTFTT